MRLRIENLSVKLSGQSILKDISIVAEEGEFLALLGPSGCGKSTLLKSIAGLVESDAGDIFLGVRRLNELPPEKRRAVIVFQDLRLFPHLSVEKNIRFAMELSKKSEDFMRTQVESLLSLVQLSGFEKRKIKELSGGQMQRIALARALASEPDILLLDEPFSGLDERLREDMADLVRRIQRTKGITTILVTHDKSEALRMADRIALMKSGEILQLDTPQKIYYEPQSLEVAEYFGKVNLVGEAMVRPSRIRLTEGRAYEIVELAFLGERVEITLERPGDKEQTCCEKLEDKEPSYKAMGQEEPTKSQTSIMPKAIAYDKIGESSSNYREQIFCTMESNLFYRLGYQKGSRVNVEVSDDFNYHSIV